MNKYFMLFWVFISFSISLSVQAGVPYAEKPSVPDEVASSYLASSIQKAEVPDAAVVNVPKYPDAKIISSFGGVKKENGSYKRLPYIELVSAGDYDQVVTFYKEKLAGWAIGGFNTAIYFAEKGSVNIFNPESTHVGVHDIANYYRENEQKDLQRIISGAKSLINIYYTVK